MEFTFDLGAIATRKAICQTLSLRNWEKQLKSHHKSLNLGLLMATVTDPLIASIPLHHYKRLVLFRFANGCFTAISSLTTWRIDMPQLSLCRSSEQRPLHLQVA